MKAIDIAGRAIGPGQPCFIVAEAGVNHNGSLETALQMVDVAREAGASAIKFQTFKAERLVTRDAPKADYQRCTTDPCESQYEMLRHLELPRCAYTRLVDHCRALKILFLSSPFDEESADFLDRLGLPAFKIPSGEITNLPLLAHVAAKNKPLIVSTGMSTLAEVESAVASIRAVGVGDLLLLQCTSNYPAEPASANLRAMETLARAFNVPVGYSDHTEGNSTALAAVALGACMIEKHFTLDRRLPGPDHAASVEPAGLAELVREIRQVEAALGDGQKRPAPRETETARVTRKSLVAACDITPGTVLTEAMVVLRRPGTGLPPEVRPYVVGRTARTAIPSGSLLTPKTGTSSTASRGSTSEWAIIPAPRRSCAGP